MIGQRLSHYRILEQIGAGGMGVVYRAHDEQLDRDVAIKVLPPGSLADEVAHKRFRKEALSLARLNHPNIATVHEFSSQDGVDFLVTEYIAGMGLDSKLARGALPPQEVIRLGVQLAAGLAAAHEQGLVHRDLKPGNLRITTDGRLKILDFGLAQFVPHPSEMGKTITATNSQDTSGTLPYMAPEQLSGQTADARTDIWAAGAVLYEMATAQRPFQQKVPALLINAILNQAPESPSKVNRAVPAPLESVILKALSHDPTQRQQSAGELAADLSRATALEALQPKRSFALFAVVAAVAVLAIAGYFFFIHRKPVATVLPPASHRRSVAVLGFKNLSANPQKSWLSTALSEMLTTELSQGGELRTIPGESVAQMKASLALPDADSFSQQTLARIRQNLGSDDVVVGSFVPVGEGLLRLDLRLQDAVAGETLASISEKGSESEIDTLVGKAGAELRAKLGIGALSDAESAAVRASLPSNPEAARLYSEGLQKLRVFDSLAARDLLEKASALSPDHAPTHSALAEAWARLGYDSKAKGEAKRAFDLSSNVSREERLLIEGRLHELNGESEQAIESYRALWTFFPDQADYGLHLIHAQLDAGHGNDAESTLAALRKLQLSDAELARIDLAEGTIAVYLSDFKRCQTFADRAATRGRAIGATLLVAEALRLEADATERMGMSEKTIQLLSESRQLCLAAGFRQGAARALLMAGDQMLDQGDFAGAKKQYEDALPVFREIGDGKRIRASLERIGNVFYGQNKPREAESYYNQALKVDQGFNDPNDLASDYGNIANCLDALGDLPGALKMQQQSLAAFTQIGDRRGQGATLNNLGNLAVEMGELEEAKKDYDQSLTLAHETSYRRGEPYPISGLADVLHAQNKLADARNQYEHALALTQEMQDEDFSGQIRVALAVLALDESRYADAESLARQAAVGFDKSNSAGSGAWAHAVLSRALLASNKVGDARAEAEKAMALSHATTGESVRYEVVLADARVKAKSGKIAEARKELEEALASARKFGYRLYEYQIWFALGQIALPASSARDELTALEKDATAHGALLAAQQAQVLLASQK
jgi:eukaryotic-like serine/threonine-protein kinase